MADDRIESRMDMITRRKLADLAYREAVSDIEMLRRLIDRAYQVDLQAYVATAEKPFSPAPPPG